MTSRTLNPKSALSFFLSHIRYTQSRLQANSLAAAHVPTFQALRNEWTTVQAGEVAILEQLSDAQALIDEADEGLDGFASRLSKAVLTITNDDRTAALYTHFFGKKSLSEFSRPTLGGQLQTMRGWVKSLSTSQYPALQAMAAELTTLVAAADAALAARDDAKLKNRQFRDVGARRQFVDKLNAARKEVYGALAKMPFTNPALPSDFADRFFRTETGDDEVEEPTIESVTARIAELEKTLAAEKELLAKLEADAAADAQAALQQKADEEALAALQKQMADLAKQTAELQQKIGKR